MRRNKYDTQHDRNLAKYFGEIEDIYTQACHEAAQIGMSVGELSADTLFAFESFPITHDRIRKLMSKFCQQLEFAIVNGVESEWTLANKKNNALSRRVFGDNVGRLTKEQYSHYFNNHDKAREAFIQRKTAGLNLSDRVWNYTNQFQREIEMGLDVGIRSGRSADELSRDLRMYLKYPDKLFRRVRDEHGELQLSKAAQAFHTGRGVYRSSYKNARRLAATETNIAYRTADYLRYQDLDFVVGIKIVLSNNHPAVDICDDLSAERGSTNKTGRGCYPKTFKFTGWHPHCRCHVETILKTEEEIERDTERLLNGEEPTQDSENSVTRLPRNYETWIHDNADRILSAKSRPYFLLDNGEFTADGKYRVKDFDGRGMLTIRPTIKAQKITVTTASGTQEVIQQTLAYTQDELTRLGWDYSDVSYRLSGLEEKWAKQGFGRFDIAKLDRDMTAIFQELGYSPTRKRFVWDADQGTVQVYLAVPHNEIRVVRKFFVNGDKMSVEHSLFELSDNLQGRGTSKKVLNCFYDQYQRLGVNSIKVHANLDVGGYTWCRYGFCAEESEVSEVLWRVKHYNKEFYSEWQQMTKIVSDFYDRHDSDTLFPMNLLTDVPNAKKILAGASWYGELKLTNPVQRKVFEKYLGR